MKNWLAITLLGLVLLIPVTVLADSGDTSVAGTEYQVGDNGTVYAHVLYANGTPADNATLNLTLWRPNGTKELDSVNMSYIAGSNGVYLYNFTVPNVTGVYLADIMSSNPTGYGSDEIHVATAVSLNCTNVTCNLSADTVWNTTITGYTDDTTFGGIINDFLGGGSVLLGGVLGLCFALMVIGFWRKSQAMLWVAALAWVGFTFWQRSLTPAWGTWNLHEIMFYVGFMMVVVSIVEAVMLYRDEQPEPVRRVPETPIARHKRMMEDVQTRARAYRSVRHK